jgi:hypothetical protein
LKILHLVSCGIENAQKNSEIHTLFWIIAVMGRNTGKGLGWLQTPDIFPAHYVIPKHV